MATQQTPPPKIGVDEHVFVAGRTGSGKTTLARELLKKVRRLVVCDTKGDLDAWGCVEWGKESKKLLLRGEPIRVRVMAPLKASAQEAQEFWDNVFETAYDAGDVRIYIDELYGIVPKPSLEPPSLKAIYTRGRSVHVTMCALTQRPAWVPMHAKSESSHYFCFRLNLPDDRKSMAAFMGEEVAERIPDRHGFYYFGGDLEDPVYNPEYKLGGK